jgi:sulfotransferase
MKKIFFNSSMPRSGSTLLQNILGNHPDIYTTPTSGLSELFLSLKKTYTNSTIFKAQNPDEMKSAFLTFCAYGLHGFFEGLTDKPYCVDKSRAWLINRNFLDCFYPNGKIICMVRDLRDILSSMEKNFRKHPEKYPLPDINKEFSLGDRITLWMQPDARPVGQTLVNLRDAIQMKLTKDVLFVRFEDLTQYPQGVMDMVHDYLGIDSHQYDFDNIQQVTHEDDRFHGIYGDHKIKNKVEPVESKAKDILGEIICNQLYEKNKWYFEKFMYNQ